MLLAAFRGLSCLCDSDTLAEVRGLCRDWFFYKPLWRADSSQAAHPLRPSESHSDQLGSAPFAAR